MRKIVNLVLALAAMVLVALPAAFAAPPAGQTATSGAAGTVVIVFKDGHRQTVTLAQIERIEFPGPVPAGLLSYPGPSRAHFTITLRDDGTALRSLSDEHGTWQYVDGEAQIRWDDGSNDCIRKVGSWYKKFWYHTDQAFAGTPENVTDARNLTQNPKVVA